jgi:hypothetical protein
LSAGFEEDFMINDVGISIMTINAIAEAGSSNEGIGSTRRNKDIFTDANYPTSEPVERED